ncbi:MAG: protein kinase family protein [Pseudomonadota bacterium]
MWSECFDLYGKKTLSKADILPELSRFPNVTVTYKKKQLLGAGMFGKTYKGIISETGQEIAVKKNSYKHAAQEDFTKHTEEMRIMAAIDHPNIVKMYAAFVQKKRFYIAMELMDENLQTFLKRSEQLLPLQTCLQIALDIATAVCYLHDQDITHGDLGIHNAVLNSRGQAKLIDFGKSHRFTSNESENESSDFFNTKPEDVRDLATRFDLPLMSYMEDCVDKTLWHNTATLIYNLEPKKRPTAADTVSILKGIMNKVPFDFFIDISCDSTTNISVLNAVKR